MKEKAVRLLDENRLMSISTNRPDGWPQTTLVGYANEDLYIYFVISRASQKFKNLEKDDRVSLVVGGDFHDPSTIKALSVAARVSEVRDAEQRDRVVKALLQRHPGLRRLAAPEPGHSAVMRASPEVITILDYSKGFGHADVLTVAPGGLTDMTPARDDDWGFGAVLKDIG